MKPIGKRIKSIAEWVLPALPRRPRELLVPPRYSWNHKDMLQVARVENAEVGLLIAPANYASQAYYWARAAETLPGVKAQNLVFGYNPGGANRKSDVAVKSNVGWYSRIWAQRQRRHILSNFTHVIYEAEREILPALYGSDLLAEIQDLQDKGIKVAMLSHGSDTRTPSEHVKTHPHSPFREDLDGLTAALEQTTATNRAVLEALDVPKFVSTPDLLNYVPNARWLPTLTDPQKWIALPPAQLGQRKLVVLHVPSLSALKGTSYVREAMSRLQDEGLVEYIEAENVPYEDMPELVGRADLVIDQMSMGEYGVAAVEAMLGGRLVVAEVGEFVRRHIREETGWDLPIIDANPDTIYEVVKGIANSPEDYLYLTVEGRQFAQAVHSGGCVAEVLRDFLITQPSHGGVVA